MSPIAQLLNVTHIRIDCWFFYTVKAFYWQSKCIESESQKPYITLSSNCLWPSDAKNEWQTIIWWSFNFTLCAICRSFSHETPPRKCQLLSLVVVWLDAISWNQKSMCGQLHPDRVVVKRKTRLFNGRKHFVEETFAGKLIRLQKANCFQIAMFEGII